MQKIAVCIGVNQVDPMHFGVPMPILRCSENDAHEMTLLAHAQGYQTWPLLGRDATLDAARRSIADAARQLRGGDAFLLTFAGHGSQVPDLTFTEHDGRNETWCLFDGEWLDHALFAALGAFVPGVGVLIVADCCHSGEEADRADGPVAVPPALVSRSLSRQLAQRVYSQNRAKYDSQPRLGKAERERTLAANVLLLASCREDQLSYEGRELGIFTEALIGAWNEAPQPTTYEALRDRIDEHTPNWQVPQLRDVSAPNDAFRKRQPFA